MDNEKWIELTVAACNDANINPVTIETIATWDQVYCANAVYRARNDHVLFSAGRVRLTRLAG